MPLEAIEPRRLYRQIADQLRQLIDHGEYTVGSRLPAERELADMLGVSRPTVREALIALEVEGRLRIRVGSGIYVNAQPPSESAPAPMPIEGPFEVLRARAFVESAVAEEAARRATPEDIARLDAILAEVDGQSLSIERWVDLDRASTAPWSRRSATSCCCARVGELFDQRINPYFVQLARHIWNDSTWRAAHVEHMAIRDAIAARHPARRQGGHARAPGALAPALLARFRRGSRSLASDNEGKPASTVAALQPGKSGNPSKTRKEPHKVAAR